MKKSIVTIAILTTGFLTGAVLFTSCNSKKTEQQEQKEEGHEHAKGEEHETVYACPMHPEVTGKEGDKCSKCGMKLEAVKNEDSTKHEH
ncbi:MAG: putative Co/Zn/Cd efflux system membrane fusion protein [Cytophagales bacterium]|jgi:hypothetical protein|nr:hypothetical protein [Bacteroidota bacterium]MBS1950768.1 hypothetical protein [Bacteroidota bacterium]MBS1980673.1 hypothetical protein [Bacteroidota bacterium]WHZ08002.1 MAG: putative Co/Zn/Cd efflux system membrane fusion protein [Cytophagales bacterium]